MGDPRRSIACISKVYVWIPGRMLEAIPIAELELLGQAQLVLDFA